MKKIVRHKYSYFTTYVLWGSEGTTFKWSHSAEHGLSMAKASYYKGKLETIEAQNPLCEGLICSGHYQWDRCPDYWYKAEEWQVCMPIRGDVEWWCLHSKNDIDLDVEFIPLTSKISVSPETSVLILEGKIDVNDKENIFPATTMNHILPRAHEISIDGDAKVWLIRKR
jgi:hypothetical protein